MSQRQEYITSQSFICATSGKDWLSRLVLSNSIDDYIRENLSYFPAINDYLNHFQKGTRDNMQENEMIDLAKDLIKMTASCTTGVGSEHIQIAVIKKNSPTSITDDSSLIRVPSIRAAGLSGCVYTSDYPFNQLSQYNFINCVIENNSVPIPIDSNFFYGSEFQNVTFEYSGGDVFFGNNNELTNCQVILDKSCLENQLNQITSFYGDKIKIIKTV